MILMIFLFFFFFWKSLSHVRLFASPWNSLGQNTGVGSLSLLQEIFPTRESNPGLPHCRLILYQLSHKGSTRILERVTYPFSSRSSRPRNQTRVSCSAGGFFTTWALRETQGYSIDSKILLIWILRWYIVSNIWNNHSIP